MPMPSHLQKSFNPVLRKPLATFSLPFPLTLGGGSGVGGMLVECWSW